MNPQRQHLLRNLHRWQGMEAGRQSKPGTGSLSRTVIVTS
jgi:hypothetical protein